MWRNELADTFVEVSPRRGSPAPPPAPPVLNLWLRSMGARIGRGVWCETYWLPEADLIDLRDGATVNRGCVVQTHLFHDRVLAWTGDPADGRERWAQQRDPAGGRSAGTLPSGRCRW